MLTYLRGTSTLLTQPARLLRGYSRAALRADLIAGASVGVVLLPQSLAFSLLAGLPPTMGLYAAILASVIGALWGSSSHLHSGPTNTASILTLSVLLPIAAPGSPEFIAAAGLIAVMAGLLRLLMGVARLGLLVNFVSDSVAVGFTAGAGILIMSNQIEPVLRLDLQSTASLFDTLRSTAAQIGELHPPSLALGLGTIGLLLILPRVQRRLPAVLLSVVASGLASWGLGMEALGVQVLGALPQSLPPLASLPLLDIDLIGQLSNGALALAIIGLVEAVAIARAVASHSRQRLDSNQEFVGQGLANIAAGVFSGYPTSGSFNRSALSFQSGAQTGLGNAFSGIFVLAAMFLLTPLIAHLPRPALAGTLVITAYSMIDRRAMARIWRGAPGDTVIMIVTLAATLALPLQFAVLIGVLMSLGYYLLKTSAPRVLAVLPDDTFRHWAYQPGKPGCPQLAVVDLLGDLYFGAANHIEESLYDMLARVPEQRFLMLRMHSVQHCDISGIRAMENILRICRERGGGMFLVRVRDPVMQVMRSTGFVQLLGDDAFLDEDEALGQLFHHTLDPAICIYECEVRAFRECQDLPKRGLVNGMVALGGHGLTPPAPELSARALWERLRGADPPLVVDVREPREYRLSHIPEATLTPLPVILSGPDDLPRDRAITLVCRSGRRSARAAAHLIAQGHTNISIVQGGMLAWEAAALLTAVEV
ncbi:STAS domain-containing protein [Oscillochloris sp. ZM17-4]|uniref:SulP family inorganic anion transporter n=1 Tax=Oscillochloris sp. ZM17-4 TaxID=2866714 RepID=UPI001C733763|nr:SulP family inorganic anion transporter [Oscillochloris sp. ZM17-4]MBX0329131.1 STAS domain-containing protein [Oscillochloris sp. ZM17-4]